MSSLLLLNFHENVSASATKNIFLIGAAGESATVTNNNGFNEVVVLNADGFALVNLPDSQAMSGTGVNDLGFQITSDGDIAGYFSNRATATTDLTVIFDQSSLGRDYVIASIGAPNFGAGEDGQFSAQALEDDTDLTITLPDGQSFMVTINAGETFKFAVGDSTGNDALGLNPLPAEFDLTGTIISATKNVAVFSGHSCSDIGDADACDHIVEQIPPVSALSTDYIVGEAFNTGSGDNLVRVVAATNGTVVNVDGVEVATLMAGEFHEFTVSNAAAVVETNHPALVAQYLQSAGLVGEGDPAFSFVPGTETWLESYTTATPDGAAVFQDNLVNIVIPTSALASLRIDGVLVDTSGFVPVPADTAFSVGNVRVDPGLLDITADEDFQVSLFGYDSFDSYLTFGGASFAGGLSNVPPVANNDAVSTDESTPVNGNALANDVDTDGDTLTVIAVNGNGASVGNEVTLPSGALVTLNADGTFTYDPNDQFNALNLGQSATDSFSYTISDGVPETDDSSATVTVTINGENAPVSFLSISNDIVQAEGDDGDLTPFTFTVTRTGDIGSAISVNYDVVGSGFSPANSADVQGNLPVLSGSITFDIGDVTETITVTVTGDNTIEPDERFTVTLDDQLPGSNPVVIGFGDRQAHGVIVNDDGLPPPPPGGRMGVIFNDPHIRTFDSLAYSFQAGGEFIGARSVSGDPLELQVRTEPVGSGLVSVTTAAAMRVGSNIVSVDLCFEPPLLINGEPVDFEGNTGSVALDGGGEVFQNNNIFTIVYPNGEQVVVEQRSTWLNVRVFLSPDREDGSLEGLLGNSDGQTINDIQVLGGDVLSLPTDFNELYGDYANSLRITNEQSLFTYKPDQDTSTFQRFDLPTQQVRPEDLPPDLVALAEQALDAAGITDPFVRNQTILDVVLTGNLDFVAAAAALALAPDVIILENFNPPDAQALLTIAPDTPSLVEGDSGTTDFTFTIFRTVSTDGAVEGTFQVAGSGDNPANADDFGGALPAGLFSFADGESETTITVSVTGDLVAEFDETFSVSIATDDAETIVAGLPATATIENDDGLPLPVLSLDLETDALFEGTGASSVFSVEVTRTGSTIEASTVDVVVAAGPGDGAEADDFVSGTLPTIPVTFNPGETSQFVTIDVVGDATLENDETFTVTLANPGDAVIDPAADSDTATILNDDTMAPVMDFGTTFELSELNGANGFVINGVAEGDQSGFSVSGAGDINDDGFQDVIIGARFGDGAATDSGISYVVFGGSDFGAGSIDLSSLDGSNGFALNGIGANDMSGMSVSDVGDVNGDGIDDVIIGAGRADNGFPDAGKAFVVFGSTDSFAAELDLSTLDGSNGFTMEGLGRYTYFGTSVSGAGDFNGDGIHDLVVGSFGANANAMIDTGETYVIFGASDLGSSGNLDPRTAFGSVGVQIEGIDAGDRSGRAVSSAGDINGDMIDDLIISAVFADPAGQNRAGESYVVFGSSDRFLGDIELAELDGQNGFVLNGIDPDDLSGRSVSGAGDVNGDGIADLIVSADKASGDGGDDQGEAYVVFGSTEFGTSGALPSLNLSDLDGSNGFVLTGIDGGDLTGRSVSGAGDVNSDGFSDLIIGAPGGDLDGRPNAGQSYVVFGASTIGGSGSWSLDDLDGENGFVINGAMPNDLSGGAVSGTGDVNGDGVDDLIVGAYGANVDGVTDAGESYVIFGVAAMAPDTEITSAVGPVSDGEAFEITVTFSENVVGFDQSDLIVSGGTVTGEVGAVDARTYTAMITPNALGVLSVDVASGAATTVGGIANTAAAPLLINVAGLHLGTLDGTNGLVIEGAGAGDEAGFSVSAAGDINDDGINDILIGARFADGAATDSGASYVVFGGTALGDTISLSSLDGTNGFALNGIGTGDGERIDVAHLGDVNADGIDDLIIGADLADVPDRVDAGQSYVVFGSSEGFDAEIDLSSLDGSNGFTMNGLGPGTFFGTSVAGAGDVNDDGVNDLIVGSFGANANGLNDTGESYLVYGTSGLGSSGSFNVRDLFGPAGVQIEGIDLADRSGRAVASAGDINNDGIDDLIIGAVFADPGDRLLAGESYVVFGTTTGFRGDVELAELDGLNGFFINGVDPSDISAREIGGLGDVNGDGIDDLIISAERADGPGAEDRGESYVVFGSSDFGMSGAAAALELSELDGSNGFVLNGIGGGDFAGRSAGAVGDINQDGINDLIIGALRADPGERGNAGQSYVVFGSTDLGAGGSLGLGDLDGANGFFLNGIDENDLSGGAAAGTGDVNGDGIDDLIVSAYLADPGGLDAAGESYVVFGSTTPGRVIEGDGTSEILMGTSGNDALRGNGGNDTLTGGGGDDIFVLGEGSGFDVIVDFDLDGDDVVNARTTGDSFDTFDVNDDDVVDAIDAGLTDRVSLQNAGSALNLLFGNGSAVLFDAVTTLGEDDIIF